MTRSTRWLGAWMLLLAPVVAAQSPRQVPVYIEDSPAAQELVEQARALRRQGRLNDAVARYQQVTEMYGTKLMPIGEGLYLEASDVVRGELLADEKLLAVYRQMYEVDAQRQRASALGEQPSAAALEAVLVNYYLTTHGLKAGLDLAGLYLERADLVGAAGVLDELAHHTDLARSPSLEARYHTLAATASLLAGDENRRAHYTGLLEASGDVEAVASIDALAHRVHLPHRLAQFARPFGGELPADPSALDRALWQVARQEHEPPRSSPYGGGQPLEVFPVLPVADADRLYLNHGDHVAALDRFSGRTIWEYRQDTRETTAMTSAMARAGRTIADRRGVLVSGDSVFAVVGQAALWSPRAELMPQAALMRLGRGDGVPRWRVEPRDLDPSLERGYFQGTPIAGYDRVFALIRRYQAAGFQDALVVAVEASTGRLLWRRHISSAVTTSRYAATPPAQMMLDRGTLYVSDNLAAVAAIDARRGRLRWERVFNDGERVSPRGIGVPRDEARLDVTPPVLVAAGLVVPPSNVSGNVVVLDPQTGRIVRTLGARELASINYLLPAGGDVVAVGRRVALLDGRTLEPRWTVPLSSTGSSAPRGEAAVTARHIIVPAGDRLTVLDREDGSIVGGTAIQGGGNVVVSDGLLVVADSGGVRSFMGWDQAYQALVEQIASMPSDPAPGLALTHLALLHERDDAVLQGVDAAIAAVESLQRERDAEVEAEREQTQQQVFDQLVTFSDVTTGAPPALREAMFDRLARLTSSPRQEVAYHLSVGRLYEDTQRWTRAVEHYQSVLLNETLASQLYHHHDVLRQAGLEARRRLTQVVESQGPAVYHRFNLIAAQQLASLEAAGADPRRLIELATRYPLADAAPLALLEAGKVLAAAGHDREAVTQFRRAYLRSSDPAVLAEIVGRLAEAYQDGARPRQAMHWLGRVSREHPNLTPLRAGTPISIDQWLRELSTLPLAQGVGASLTLPLGRPYLIEGQLLLATHQPADEPLGSRVLTRQGQVLRMYGSTPLRPIWEAALPAADVQLLAVGDEQVLMWSDQSETLISLDATTGEPTWPTVKPDQLLETLGDQADRRAAQPREQREFMQMIDVNAPVVVRGGQVVVQRPEPEKGYLTAIGGGVICIADRFGGIVGIDRHSGQMLWQAAVPIEQVSHLRLDGEALAIAGVSGAGTDALSGAVQVLDPLTGEPILPVLEDKEPPQWIDFSGASSNGRPGSSLGSGRGDVPGVMDSSVRGGLMVVATTDQVTAYRLDDGEVVWRLSIAGPPLTGRGWASAELILLATNGHELLAIDPGNGELRTRLQLHTAADGTSAEPLLVDDQWQLLTPSRATALRSDGEVHWRDARMIQGEGEHLVQQLVGERHVVLLGQVDQAQQWRGAMIIRGNGPMRADVVVRGPDGVLMRPPQDDSEQTSYDLFILDRATGRMLAEYQVADLPNTVDVHRAQFIDDHLLLAAGAQTVVIPGARGGP